MVGYYAMSIVDIFKGCQLTFLGPAAGGMFLVFCLEAYRMREKQE